MNIETLQAKHIHMGFLDVLSELTEVDLPVDEATESFYEIMREMNGNIFVAIDESRIVGTVSIHILPKFVHHFGYVGLIEDLVVTDSCRGMGYGKILVDFGVQYANNKGVYKVILDCSLDNIPFYESCGFYKKEQQMRMDL